MSALSILAEECELLNDSKYRSYITQVEKALKSFEYTSEWADLISALGKLNKVLLAHVKYPVIPKRVTIGKRLAQCLHPALPGGVHLKALETYDIILKCIGTQRLAQDLFIYSAGLFPLLGFAAMNVKPVLLSLFERHFVALGKHIKPGLNGMLLGLLPGLEEGSEYHERTNALLEDFMEATEPEYFFTCLWECILSCPSARLSAISFLLSHFNKKKTMEDQIYMMGVNIDLMVEALCQTSQDSVVLVQRSMLDFLLLAFPMHNKQLTRCDMAKIMKHVIKVVLRRDMSLNRRLYTWLLGTGANASNQHQTEKLKRQSSASSEGELGYFFTYSKDLLIEALKSKLDNPQDDEDFNAQSDNRLEVLKPFRILISLLDKPEIGPIILENLLLPVFQCLHRECKQVHPNESVTDTENTLKSEKDRKSDDAKHYYELIKTANLLFGTFEPYFIWDFIGRAYEKACVSAVNKDNLQSQVTDTPTISELCTLVGYLLDIISLGTFLETQTEHLPEMLLRIITNLSNHCIKMKEEDVKASLQLCSKLLAKVQPAMDTLETDGTTSLMDEVIDEEYVEIKGNEETLGELNTGKQNKTDDQSLKGSSANDSGKPVKKYNRQSSQSSFGKDSGRKNSKSHTAMQSCIDSYKSFFHTFLVDKFFAEGCSIEKYFQTLCTIQAPYTYYTDDDSLIDSDSVYSCDLDDSKAEDQDGKPCKKEELIVGKSASVIENFNLACSLLLDFSSFPIYCTDLHKILQRSTSSDTSLTLPAWLQDLMVCCCFAGCYEIQSTAISTMLDLITMTRSIQSASDIQHDLESRPGRAYCINEGLVSVLIVPALLPFQLKYIGERTTFFRRTCQILWDFLDLHTPLYHEKSVDLLYQLHQAAPSAWVCEDVIGKALVSDTQEKQIAAFQKFTVLWHLGRDIKLDHAPGCVPKTFDRSLFVFLDSLKEDSSPTKTIVSTWLTHIIQRGDISRVLTPLLMMLLHPDTARVSVQHINVHKPEKIELGESDEDIRKSEARIIAISSDGGHVIYHLNPDERFSAKSEEELKAYAFTSVNKYGATETAPVTKPLIDDEHHYEKVQAKDLSLTMNPFGSQNSLDKIIYDGFEPPFVRPANLTGAKRLDKETCAKEGIVFDDSESNPSLFSDSSPLEESPEHFVRELLMGIVNQVVPLEMESYSSADADEELHASIKAKIGDNAMTEGGIGNASSYHLSEDQEILNSIDSKGMQVDSPTNSELDLAQADKEGEEQQSMDIHPLHLHMLLYTQKYDFRRTMYALSTLKSMLVTCPRLVVTSLVTSSISGSRTQQLAKLQILLGRHRKSVFGKDFYGEVPPEAISSYRSNMFIEIIISICLYLVRSYYPNLMISKLSAEELQGNKEVHILSTEVLTLLTSELIRIMKESGKSFASYIKDLLNRCKLQKALLHCCLASVYNMSRQTNSSNKITEAIVAFNENNLDPSFTETFQIKLLNLLLVMIMLEDRMERNHGESHDLSTGTTQSDLPKIRNNFQQYLLNAKYLGTSPIVHQSMFLSCILSAMKQMHMRHAHRHWIAMVTSSLPYMGKTLSAIVINVIAQLCRNLELVAVQYEDPTKFREGEQVPCDHLLTMLEGMTTICHYCLLDTASPVSVGLPAPTSNSITTDTGSAGQILNNLIHVFNPINSGKESSPQRELGPLSPVMDARRSLLSIMPRIIACLLALWKAANAVEAKIKYKKPSPSSIMGEPKLVKQKILEFLSPVSLPHGNHMLGAVGVAWNDRRKNATSTYKKFNMPPCEDQLLLVELVSSIKVLPTDTLVQTVKQVLKQPPPTDLAKFKKSIPLEVNMLQFFYAYVKQTTSSQLVDSWPSLLSLLRESLQIILLPPGKFILVQILNEFVQKMPSFEDKKNQRDLQDITQKLLEAVSLIAGSSLEQTTWLRRNLAVKPGPQNEKLDLDDDELGEDGTSMVEIKQRKATMDSKQPNASDSKYSVHALSILAEYTSPLLDVVYGSDEKDKVPPILTTLLYSVFPYLRTHSSNNLPSYRACSQILASISSFQYTRKSWRKEALELLLDNGFFMMDLQCLQFWKCIIDNLMTHDKTTFKDLMSRVSITQSASLNLFSSKEQELEQRAQMLKRLAFTLYCSEPDQYQKSMPDIQERLAESLRMPHQVPSVMSQVFLCFRVLILRMSSHHLTSLWPTVITEMVHVFMQIEQELSSDTDEYTTQIQRIAALDSSWAHLGNGLNAHNNPSWLQLYLSVCKLLDMALALPADVVPQFQLYRWAFIGGSVEQEAKGISPEEKKEEAKRRIQRAPSFTPHIVRLAKLINQKIKGPTPIMKQVSGRPMLTQPYMKSLAELQPFFNTLCNSKHTDNSIMITNHPGNFQGVNHQLNISKQTMAKSVSTPEFTKSRYLQQTMSSLAQGMPSSSKSNREYIEELVERDFLEPMSA